MISVIIPTYNREEFILEAVRSVLNQDEKDFELVVVDDGSTINMQSLEELLKSNNAKYVRTENEGVSAARNLGVSKTTGEWLAFLDSDDCWKPQKLKIQKEYLTKNHNYQICQTEEVWHRHKKFVNPKLRHGKPNGEAFFRSLELCCISPSSVMLSRKLFNEVGGFDERMKVCEDYDLWIRITAKYDVGLVPEVLVQKNGGHDDQLSHSEKAIDRFRIFSLVKNLTNLDLTLEQYQAILKEISTKTRIVSQGAKKRNNNLSADLYEKINNLAESKLKNHNINKDLFVQVFNDLLLDIKQ